MEKEADALKDKGNEAYKAKKFDEALNYYNQALEKNPREMIYYSNKCAVYIEQKNLDEALRCIETAIEQYAELEIKDFSKLAKLYARKASIL